MLNLFQLLFSLFQTAYAEARGVMIFALTLFGRNSRKSLSVSSGEIRDDEFADEIRNLLATADIRTVIEIGSGSGAGSTSVIVDTLSEKGAEWKLYCFENDTHSINELSRRYGNLREIKIMKCSTISDIHYMSAKEVLSSYLKMNSQYKRNGLFRVLAWRREEKKSLKSKYRISKKSALQELVDNIGVRSVDAVLIDGSEFTARKELQIVYGSRYILLDDICTIKNFVNFDTLSLSSLYTLYHVNDVTRNGFAIFRRVD